MKQAAAAWRSLLKPPPAHLPARYGTVNVCMAYPEEVNEVLQRLVERDQLERRDFFKHPDH